MVGTRPRPSEGLEILRGHRLHERLVGFRGDSVGVPMIFWLKHFFSNWGPHRGCRGGGPCLGYSFSPPITVALDRTFEGEFGGPERRYCGKQFRRSSFICTAFLSWARCIGYPRRIDNIILFPPRKYLSLLVWLPAIIMFIVYSFDPTLSKPLSHTLIWISLAFFFYT